MFTCRLEREILEGHVLLLLHQRLVSVLPGHGLEGGVSVVHDLPFDPAVHNVPDGVDGRPEVWTQQGGPQLASVGGRHHEGVQEPEAQGKPKIAKKIEKRTSLWHILKKDVWGFYIKCLLKTHARR